MTMMTAKLLAILLVVNVALSACQKKEEKANITNEKAQTSAAEALKAIDRNLGGVVPSLMAAQVSFEKVEFDYRLPEQIVQQCQNTLNPDVDLCPQITIELAKIKPIWIESTINRQITDDDNHEKYLKFTQVLNDTLAEKINSENMIPYRLTVSPVQLPSYKNIAQFAIEKQIIDGEKTTNTIDYLLFDMDYQSRISFGDIILGDGGEKLQLVLELAFDHYIYHTLEITSKKQLNKYKNKHQLSPSQNVYFASDGLVFVYPPDTLAESEYGFVKLSVPYEQLFGVINDRYLPKQK